MEDAPLMSIMDRAGDGRHQGRGGTRVRGVSRHVGRQVPALDELHAEVMVPFVLADLVDRHDVRVIEVRRGLRLQAEPLQVVGGREPARSHHLERHHAVEADLASLENDPHPALSDHLDEIVVAKVTDPAIDSGPRGGGSRLSLGPDQVLRCAGWEGQHRGRVAGSPMIAQGGGELLQVLPIGEERR